MKIFLLLIATLIYSFPAYAKRDDKKNQEHMKAHREKMQTKREEMKQNRKKMKKHSIKMGGKDDSGFDEEKLSETIK